MRVFHPDERNQPLQASSLCIDVPTPSEKNREKKVSSPDFFLRKGGHLCTGYRPLAGGNCKKGKQNSKPASGKGQLILPLSFLCLVPCHLLVISILFTPGESMFTGFSTSKQEYGDPHFLKKIFMTSASFQRKPNWQNLCSGFFFTILLNMLQS